MNGIELTSANYRVTKITKKTRAIHFTDMREGDVIRFKMTMSSVGQASGGGCYASIVTVENITQGTVNTSKSQTAVSGILYNFELTEVAAQCTEQSPLSE